jgi:2-aminoadipate transaminase
VSSRFGDTLLRVGGSHQAMRSSTMRDLLALTEHGDVISLAGGLPSVASLPPGSYAARMNSAAQADREAGGPAQAEDPGVIRECIVEAMAAEGLEVDPDEVVLTAGGPQAIDAVCRALLYPGDVVVAEAPTHPGAVASFCACRAEVVQIAMDRDGMRIDELERALGELDRMGRPPKLIYTVPNFHNPAGVTLSLERRRELLRIAHERELLVLEHNPYGLLRYEGAPLPPLRSLDGGERVLYTSTFSKFLSPAVALGWTAVPHALLRRLRRRRPEADGDPAAGPRQCVGAYFDAGRWEQHVRSLIEIYRRRRDAMLDALAEHFPREVEWTHPEGGLFVWVTLPDYIDTTDLLARALEHQVAFVPGRAAYSDGRGGSALRLNFAAVNEEQIRDAVRRLGDIVRAQVALYGTLTGLAPASAGQAETAPPPSPWRGERPTAWTRGSAPPSSDEEAAALHLANVVHLPVGRGAR